MLSNFISNRDLTTRLLHWLPLKSFKNLCLVNKYISQRIKTVAFNNINSRKYMIRTDEIRNPEDVSEWYRNNVKHLLIDTKIDNINILVDTDIYKLFVNLNSLTILNWYMPDKKLVLPDTLIRLNIWDRHYNFPLPVLPPRLKYLVLPTGYTQKLDKNMIPDTLEEISINGSYPSEVTSILPANLKVLSFGIKYSHPIDIKSLPQSLTKLFLPHTYFPVNWESFHGDSYTLDYKFLPSTLLDLHHPGNIDIAIGSLPCNLYHLYIHKYIYELQCGSLSANLSEVFISHYLYDLKPGVLPSKLKWLNLPHMKGKILPNSIPSSVKHLKIYWNGTDPSVIPPTVKHLELRVKYYENMIPTHFPSNINKLSVETQRNNVIKKGQLPKTHTILICGYGKIEDGAFDDTECKDLSFNLGTVTEKILPPNIISLRISGNVNIDIKAFPSSLRYLKLYRGCVYNLPPLDNIKVTYSYF